MDGEGTRTLRRALRGLTALGAAIALAGAVAFAAFDAAMSQLEERAHADLDLAADRLEGQLARYRTLATLLAADPRVTQALRGADPPTAALRGAADRASAAGIALYAPDGTRIAATGAPGGTPAGLHIARALGGALGTWSGLVDGRRAFVFAAPVFDGGPAGAVTVTVDIARIEATWRADPTASFFTDSSGTVFLSNRSELLFRTRGPGGGDRPFFRYDSLDLTGREIWLLDGGRYLPSRALHLTRPLPVIGMTGEILADITPAIRLAAGAGALALAFATIVALVLSRLRAARRIGAALERQVARRTEALRLANQGLAREVDERRAAQAALEAAQAELVQAGRMSALGQMSAGISHELNQPLMAIRTWAANARAFLARGDAEAATGNLERIDEMGGRMGRIIAALRAFARERPEPAGTCDLAAVVGDALALEEGRLERAGVAVDWTPPDRPVPVTGGAVRLGQVVSNLIRNAADAMAGAPERRLTLALAQGDPVVLTVSDTGPGLDAPEKVFDAFYTTKPPGEAEGMGLGLSISYAIVDGFGGAIRAGTAPGGGAEFAVSLPAAPAAEAAA
ncbi:MAG: ATP-binding protein [Hasllibacter sp.]